VKNTIKNWLSYFQNLLKWARNSKWFILFVGFILGNMFNVEHAIRKMTMWQWVILSVATILMSYFFYIKYKLNQDTNDRF